MDSKEKINITFITSKQFKSINSNMKSDKEIKNIYLTGRYSELKDSERVRLMDMISNKEFTKEEINNAYGKNI